MKKLKSTLETKTKIEVLKTIKDTQWYGDTTHDSIETCLTAINLYQGTNSGWYNPKAVMIDGIQGIYMINEDGGLNFESRIIKEDENIYRIEHLTNDGYNDFENKYLEIMQK